MTYSKGISQDDNVFYWFEVQVSWVVAGHQHTTPRLLAREQRRVKSRRNSTLYEIFLGVCFPLLLPYNFGPHPEIPWYSRLSIFSRSANTGSSWVLQIMRRWWQVTVCMDCFVLFSFFSPHTHPASQSSRLSYTPIEKLVFRLRSTLARMTFTRPCVWGSCDNLNLGRFP